MWKQIGVCPDWQCDERLWHAGLSADGTKCFVSGFEENVYIVWDIMKQSVVWRDDGSSGESEIQPLEKWIDSDGCISIAAGSAKEKYRIFGVNFNHAKTESVALNQLLEVDAENGVLIVRESGTGSVICDLQFDAFSGDWAFASFSENDAVIAVIEPYSVTFFGRA